MPRSFISVELDDEIRESLVRAQEKLGQIGGDIKIVEPENIHLTLKFLGDISRSKLRAVEEVLGVASYVDPFRIQVSSLGVFPNPSFIRVVWAGVDEGSEKIKTIRKEIDESLSEVGISTDDEKFTPHYTIARVKSGKGKEKIRSLVEENSDKRWGEYVAEDIKLKKSELTSEGPVYSTLESFELE